MQKFRAKLGKDKKVTHQSIGLFKAIKYLLSNIRYIEITKQHRHHNG